MDDIVAWRSPCLEHNWRDGKGMVFLRGIEYYKRHWVDIRILNQEKIPGTWTKHWLRLTVEQGRELLPALQQLIEEMQDEEERKQRRESGERDTR